MNELDLFLRIMQGANLATPHIVNLIAAIRLGKKEGKTDAEIEAQQIESMQIALRTRAKSEQQMGDQS